MKYLSELYKAQLDNLREQVVLDIVRHIEKTEERVIEFSKPLFYEAVDDQCNKVVEAVHQDETVTISCMGELEETSFKELSVEYLIGILEAIEAQGHSLITTS